MEQAAPVTLGIAGGSGSGKTTVASALLERVGPEHITIVTHDSYYKDLSHLARQPTRRNQFRPPGFARYSIDDPAYPRVASRRERAHSLATISRAIERTAETRAVAPRPIILVEGILILAEASLRALCDIKIFVDIDPDVRFIRRLERDTQERGRSVASVIQQYMRTVRPMHLRFVEPSKRYADVIIPEGGYNTVAIEMVAERIRRVLAERD